MSAAVLRQVRPDDLDRCYEIESTAYEGDEAATREKIATRIALYPQGFIVLELDGVIAGFINSGCADQVQMSDESFKELVNHHADGAQNVIMSVVVHPDYQRRGLAGQMLQHYIGHMRALGKQCIRLMCREQHIALYRSHGFGYDQPSDSAHGNLAWHEMTLPLRH